MEKEKINNRKLQKNQKKTDNRKLKYILNCIDWKSD